MRGTIKGILFTLFYVGFIISILFGTISFFLFLFNWQLDPFIGQIVYLAFVFLLLVNTTIIGYRQLKQEHNQFGHGIIAGAIFLFIPWVIYVIEVIL